MRIFELFDRFFFTIAKLSIVICVLLITFSAVGRYFFGTPIPGSYLINENFLMVIMIFMSFSYTWKEKGFVSVTLVYDKFPIKVKQIIYILIVVAGIVFFSLVGYQGYLITVDDWVNQTTFSGLVQLPAYLSRIWVPLGSFILVLRMIFELIIEIRKLIQKSSSNNV
jgi:TRAP-type transport system small permease protein